VNSGGHAQLGRGAHNRGLAWLQGVGQGCLCVRPSVSSVCSSVTSDKVHVRPISKYSSILSIF
jgi:hypothetical protein